MVSALQQTVAEMTQSINDPEALSSDFFYIQNARSPESEILNAEAMSKYQDAHILQNSCYMGP